MNYDQIKKHDQVYPTDFPDRNGITWNKGTVIKFNMDEDEALIELPSGRRLWIDVVNLRKYD